jgi:hypothetical protein
MTLSAMAGFRLYAEASVADWPPIAIRTGLSGWAACQDRMISTYALAPGVRVRLRLRAADDGLGDPLHAHARPQAAVVVPEGRLLPTSLNTPLGSIGVMI